MGQAPLAHGCKALCAVAMDKISGLTFFYKKFFPTIWFGFLAFVLAVPLFFNGEIKSVFLFFMAPLIMAVMGFLMFKKLCWDLVDEVFDDDDALVVRKGGKEQVVNLNDIINVSHSQMGSPDGVTIHTRSGGPIGKEFTFILPTKINPFSKNPVVAELIERIDNARRR